MEETYNSVICQFFYAMIGGFNWLLYNLYNQKIVLISFFSEFSLPQLVKKSFHKAPYDGPNSKSKGKSKLKRTRCIATCRCFSFWYHSANRGWTRAIIHKFFCTIWQTNSKQRLLGNFLPLQNEPIMQAKYERKAPKYLTQAWKESCDLYRCTSRSHYMILTFGNENNFFFWKIAVSHNFLYFHFLSTIWTFFLYFLLSSLSLMIFFI